MIKKTITITLVIILNLVILCGCIEESNNNSNNMITLDKLSLDLDDLYEEGYTKLHEIHKTNPYNASEGVFEGWLILEKYEVLLQKNLSSFIYEFILDFEKR